MTEFVVYVDSNNRNQTYFPNSNTFTLYLTSPITNISKVELLSAMLPSIQNSQYITLDITELRTPTHMIADALTTNTLIATPTANAFSGSFATLPVKPGNIVYNPSYVIETVYPSRIEKLDRLTITWRQPNNGKVFIDGTTDMGRTMFLLKFTTIPVPTADDVIRDVSLPDPVNWDSGERRKMIIIAVVALGGLFIIMSMKHRHA